MCQQIGLLSVLVFATLFSASTSLLMGAQTSRKLIKEPSFVLPHRACYFASWARYRPGAGQYLPTNVDPNLCTILLYAFGQITNNEVATFDWKDEDNFKELIALKQQNPDFKVVLSVGGWTLKEQFAPMASSVENRKRFVASCVTKVRQWNLDGIDLDWEYPTLAQKANFSALVQELRTAFDEEARTSGKTRLILGAAVGAIQTDGYDVAVMASEMDFVNVMTYDFHGSGWEPSKTGHNSPLYPSSSDPLKLSISGAMERWVNLGMPKTLLNVGLAFYGRSWTLINADNHELGAPANGPASAGPFTREAGIFGFNEICTSLLTGQLQSIFDTEIQSPYAFGGITWVGYDDAQSIRTKAQYIKSEGFAGGFVWEVSNDDFHGACYGKPKILLEALSEELVTGRGDIPSFARRTSKITKATRKTSMIPVVTTPRTTQAPALLEKQVCDSDLCATNGLGSFPLGGCENAYCDCTADSHPYLRQCPDNLVYDAHNRYCNWKASVTECQQLERHLF